MKKITLFAAVIFCLYNSAFTQNTSVFTDKREKKEYKTVKIGEQIWFAENLAYKPTFGAYDAYEMQQSNIPIYGYLYDFETAKKVCPEGWHLPSDYEWRTLELSLGLNADEFENINQRGANIGQQLKSENGWYDDENGTNSSFFDAKPAGAVLFYDNSFNFLTEKAYFWTSTPQDVDAFARVLTYDDNYVERALFSKKNEMSVRCLKNEPK